MKQKEGFVLRTVCGEHVIVGEGLGTIDFGKLISLNETAAWIWKKAGEMSGTMGESKRLEGIRIRLGGAAEEDYIEYRTHVQTYGWEEVWKKAFIYWSSIPVQPLPKSACLKMKKNCSKKASSMTRRCCCSFPMSMGRCLFGIR